LAFSETVERWDTEILFVSVMIDRPLTSQEVVACRAVELSTIYSCNEILWIRLCPLIKSRMGKMKKAREDASSYTEKAHGRQSD
jgi:hypothetical protein